MAQELDMCLCCVLTCIVSVVHSLLNLGLLTLLVSDSLVLLSVVLVLYLSFLMFPSFHECTATSLFEEHSCASCEYVIVYFLISNNAEHFPFVQA